MHKRDLFDLDQFKLPIHFHTNEERITRILIYYMASHKRRVGILYHSNEYFKITTAFCDRSSGVYYAKYALRISDNVFFLIILIYDMLRVTTRSETLVYVMWLL